MKGEDQTMLLGEQWKAVKCEPKKSLATSHAQSCAYYEDQHKEPVNRLGPMNLPIIINWHTDIFVVFLTCPHYMGAFLLIRTSHS